jgi:putative phosphoribosyl transferase
VRFRNRIDAGLQLAELLAAVDRRDVVVLGLPRGGVPVAWVVAKRLGAPLDVFVARKVGAPGHEELGIGAVAEGTRSVTWTETAAMVGLSERQLNDRADQAHEAVRSRVLAYRGTRPPTPVTAKSVILVDDGLATGVTAEAALHALREQQPRRLTLGVPVGSPETVERLAHIADEVVCVATPDPLFAVGEWYDDFRQTSDDEVRDLLARRT